MRMLWSTIAFTLAKIAFLRETKAVVSLLYAVPINIALTLAGIPAVGQGLRPAWAAGCMLTVACRCSVLAGTRSRLMHLTEYPEGAPGII